MPASMARFIENFREFFSRGRAERAGEQPSGRKLGTNFGGFGDRIKEVFFPAKLPPLR